MRMTRKYKQFLPPGAHVMNYVEKASGRDCEICGHTPESRPPKPGYPIVSEDMRVMRVQLATDTDPNTIKIGKTDFTITGNVIEINVCADSDRCRRKATQRTNEDGSPMWDKEQLQRLL